MSQLEKMQFDDGAPKLDRGTLGDSEKKDDKDKPEEEINGRKPRIQRKPLTEEMLISKDGLMRVYEEFPKNCKFHGRGSEAKDIKRMCTMYKEWAFQLHPGIAFPDFLQKCNELGSKARVRTHLEFLRDTERNRYLTEIMGVSLPSASAFDDDEIIFSTENSSKKQKTGSNETIDKSGFPTSATTTELNDDEEFEDFDFDALERQAIEEKAVPSSSFSPFSSSSS